MQWSLSWKSQQSQQRWFIYILWNQGSKFSILKNLLSRQSEDRLSSETTGTSNLSTDGAKACKTSCLQIFHIKSEIHLFVDAKMLST